VSDLTEVTVENIDQVYECINIGNAKRAFASTMANQYSSRSHAILQVMVEVEKPNNEKVTAKLYIIDLAGSEKLQSLNCSKKMQEGAHINKSLLALGNCINILA
jgi:kinesin family protein 18/19